MLSSSSPILTPEKIKLLNLLIINQATDSKLNPSIPRISLSRYAYFYLAALSLMCSGWILSSNHDILELIVLIWCVISGVILIYGFNACVDDKLNLAENIRSILQIRRHQIIGAQFFLIAIPVALLVLTKFSIVMLSAGAILGLLYAWKFQFFSFSIKLKNILLIKNLLIGLVWGGLVLLSLESFNDELVFKLFLFVSIQVLVGSIIRDIADNKVDVKRRINSIPVVFGIRTALTFSHALNIASLGVVFIGVADPEMLIIGVPVVLWRLVNLIFLQRDINNTFWSQKVNLLTCSVVLVCTILSSVLYG